MNKLRILCEILFERFKTSKNRLSSGVQKNNSGRKNRERLHICYPMHRQKNLILRRQVKSGISDIFPPWKELIDSFKSGKFIGGIVVLVSGQL